MVGVDTPRSACGSVYGVMYDKPVKAVIEALDTIFDGADSTGGAP